MAEAEFVQFVEGEALTCPRSRHLLGAKLPPHRACVTDAGLASVHAHPSDSTGEENEAPS